MKRLALFLALLGTLVLTPAAALAYDPTTNICGDPNTAKSTFCNCDTNSPATSACENTSQNPLTGPKGLILTIANLIAVLAGVAAVITIIIAGFRYITSGGDPQAVKGAQGALVAALVGVAIIALADAIITFVVSKV